MPYKPKFCCQCGEKIETADRKIWTSRRFCELCQTEFGIYERAAQASFLLALLFGFAGIFYFFKSEKPLNVAPNQFVGSLTNVRSDAANKTLSPPANVGESVRTVAQANDVAPVKLPIAAAVSDLKIKPVEPQSNSPEQKVYFCGAITKKGTLCSRRVKGGGRCWQHTGQEAMVPQAKLLASR